MSPGGGFLVNIGAYSRYRRRRVRRFVLFVSLGSAMNRLLLFPVLFASLGALAQPSQNTIRICDETGCSDRPRNYAPPPPAVRPEEAEAERRLAKLTAAAENDPRAAYDLGLRYFRGDGVRRDSYQALKWMREAAERGDLNAQLAVGRLYLMGLEEMGSDPAEAEVWLSMAAGRGNGEAKKLLAEASAAKKKSQEDYQKWVDSRRTNWYNYWSSGYVYRGHWRGDEWYFHH